MIVHTLYFAHYACFYTIFWTPWLALHTGPPSPLHSVKAATEEMSSSDKPLQMETNRVHCALSRLVIVAIVIAIIIIVIAIIIIVIAIIIVMIVVIIVICVKRW